MPMHLLIPDGVTVDPTMLAAQLAELQVNPEHLTARRLDVDASVFAKPDLDSLTAVREDASTGRISGYIASLGVCHTGISGVCVTAPLSKRDWLPFARYDLAVGEDGALVAVGRLSHGARHFGPGTYGAAIAYHDPLPHHAYVVAGADERGIWVSGTRNELVADSTVRTALSLQNSGDWRRFAGALELTDVLTVDDPGYPVEGALVASASGEPMFDYLVAVGIVTPEASGCGCPHATGVDPNVLASITAGLELVDGPLAPQNGAEVVYGGATYSFSEQVAGPDGPVWIIAPVVDTPRGLDTDYSARLAVPAADCALTGKRYDWAPDERAIAGG